MEETEKHKELLLAMNKWIKAFEDKELIEPIKLRKTSSDSAGEPLTSEIVHK